MGAPEGVVGLVERFERNIDQYRSPVYNETQLRREFLDPLFGFLGWDVDNHNGYAEAYKDVVHEDSIRVHGSARAPDYCFRVGGKKMFFVEAKKPATNIKTDLEAAFQVRRYGWSAKLPISILSDFDAFAVYDTRARPAQLEKASTARLEYWTYLDYLDHWDDIASIFSRDAVYKGSFDRYVQDTKRHKGTAEVDQAFLTEIETWRERLAHEIAVRNQTLTARELNFAVQRTIDRIVFLRICEARGIEPEGQLREITQRKGVYQSLLGLFTAADARYNSGIFHFRHERARSDDSLDTLTPSIEIHDMLLRGILKDLYYPVSPYEFSVLPADILGQVYEQFLGKVITLTDHHNARVEQKPEVRKAGGVYYTPGYIVEYLVTHTVDALLSDKTPETASTLRIVDPACGSGSFLIAAYQHLLDWHLQWYLEHRPQDCPERVYQGAHSQWRLTIAERKRILLNNIYGVDIDEQAVEVTKLSLALKVLEGQTSETLPSGPHKPSERALPDLDSNIACGNSLVGPDFYDSPERLHVSEDEAARINAFDWTRHFAPVMREGGFDVVVGNPPYIRVHRLDPLLKGYLWKRYESFAEKGDFYACFMERGLELLKPGGLISFITPNTWTSLQSFRHLRKLILDQGDILQLVRTPARVFKEATVRTMVFVFRRRGSEAPAPTHPIFEMDQTGHTEQVSTGSRDSIMAAHQKNFLLFADDEPEYGPQDITIASQLSFAYGFKTGDDSFFLADEPRGESWLPYSRSADIDTLTPLVLGGWVDYRPQAMRQHRKTARPGDLARFLRPKIIVARMGRRLVATYDETGGLVKDAMLLMHPADNTEQLRIATGILASTYMNELYLHQFVTIDVLKNALLSLPLPSKLCALAETPNGRELSELVALTIEAGSESSLRSARLARINELVQAFYEQARHSGC